MITFENIGIVFCFTLALLAVAVIFLLSVLMVMYSIGRINRISQLKGAIVNRKFLKKIGWNTGVPDKGRIILFKTFDDVYLSSVASLGVFDGTYVIKDNENWEFSCVTGWVYLDEIIKIVEEKQ